jgi:hypothetical protein
MTNLLLDLAAYFFTLLLLGFLLTRLINRLFRDSCENGTESPTEGSTYTVTASSSVPSWHEDVEWDYLAPYGSLLEGGRSRSRRERRRR